MAGKTPKWALHTITVSVRPAPKGGCGRGSRRGAGAPAGGVSVRPAPKGGCGLFQMAIWSFTLPVSVRPAPKGGCGPNLMKSVLYGSSLSEARPEGRVWQRFPRAEIGPIQVSVRPAPKGGCGVLAPVHKKRGAQVSVRPAPKGGCGIGLPAQHSRTGYVSVRPAPKGGCGAGPLGSTVEGWSVSVRPAPKGGCGSKGFWTPESKPFASQ